MNKKRTHVEVLAEVIEKTKIKKRQLSSTLGINESTLKKWLTPSSSKDFFPINRISNLIEAFSILLKDANIPNYDFREQLALMFKTSTSTKDEEIRKKWYDHYSEKKQVVFKFFKNREQNLNDPQNYFALSEDGLRKVKKEILIFDNFDMQTNPTHKRDQTYIKAETEYYETLYTCQKGKNYQRVVAIPKYSVNIIDEHPQLKSKDRKKDIAILKMIHLMPISKFNHFIKSFNNSSFSLFISTSTPNSFSYSIYDDKCIVIELHDFDENRKPSHDLIFSAKNQETLITQFQDKHRILVGKGIDKDKPVWEVDKIGLFRLVEFLFWVAVEKLWAPSDDEQRDQPKSRVILNETKQDEEIKKAADIVFHTAKMLLNIGHYEKKKMIEELQKIINKQTVSGLIEDLHQQTITKIEEYEILCI